MNDPVTTYLAQSDSLSLTPEERSAVRFALQANMAMTLTQDEKTDIRRALQRVVYAEPAPVSAWSWLSIRLPAMSLAAFLLLAASGGGLVYAAERAVPGDMLYGIKIHLNEELRARFQVTPEHRAQWAIRRLERRMDELRRLAERGTPDEELDLAIGMQLEAIAHDVQTEVEGLPATAAERAAARTAVNAAIGNDQDSLRRASRINRVLKALKERADTFDAPIPAAIVPPPAVPKVPVPAPRATAEGTARAERKVQGGAQSSAAAVPASSRPTASSRRAVPASATAEATSSLEATVDIPDAEATEDAVLPPPVIDDALDTVEDAVDRLL